MGKFINYYEEAKILFLKMGAEIALYHKEGMFSEEEFNDKLQSLLIISEVVNSQYSQGVLEKNNSKVLFSKTYFNRVKDQVEIYIDYTMENPFIGIGKENIPSKDFMEEVVDRLKSIK